MYRLALLCFLLAVCAPAVGAPGGYRPFDGTGRYTMDQADGVKEIQGLAALAGRHGLKPYDLLGKDGRWQTERVIFTDVSTGATIYRLTNDPFADEICYFKGNVSADGSTLVFRRKPGMWEGSTATHGPMAMNTDGTGLRNVFRDFGLVRKLATSFTDPRFCYAMANEKKIVAFDLKSGKLDHEIADVGGCWWLKVSPDGRYVMGRGKLSTGVNGLYIYSVDGKERYEIPVPEAIHDSYQFHPTQRKVMYWYEGKFHDEGFVQRNFDGSGLEKVNVPFDWNHGDVGLDRGAHCEGYVTRIAGDTWKPREWLNRADPKAEYYDDPADYNGYLAWRPKDALWAYSTRIMNRPYLSEIHLMDLDPVPGDVASRCRICYTNLHRKAGLDNPESSPDGTKVFFNSTMLGSMDVYMVVARNPEPPVRVATSYANSGAPLLAWDAPPHCREICRYRIYRSEQSGSGYREVGSVLAAREQGAGYRHRWLDVTARDGRLYYVITAEEYSGLESRPSNEASVGAAGPAHLYFEAEGGTHGPEVWRAFDGAASGLYYLWNRKKGTAGSVTLSVQMPRAGSYRAWVRARSLSGVPVRFSVGSAAAEAAPANWTWVPLAGELALKAGQQDLPVGIAAYGGAVDQLYLSSDGTPPVDGPRLPGFAAGTAVAGLKGEAQGPFAVRLAWDAVADRRLHHYDLYVSKEAGFQPGPATLVASPDTNEYVDWSLSPGTTYHYRVAAVDRNGAMLLSPEAEVTTAPLQVEKVEAAYEKDKPVAITVGQPGQYVVWLKLKAGAGAGQYMELSLGKRKVTWTIQPDHLADEMWYRYNEYALFPLEKGENTLAIANKTPHTIESVLVTNDLSFTPAGHINIQSGW